MAELRTEMRTNANHPPCPIYRLEDEGETEFAYTVFWKFLELGVDRTITAAWLAMGKKLDSKGIPSTANQYSYRYKWVERSHQYDEWRRVCEAIDRRELRQESVKLLIKPYTQNYELKMRLSGVLLKQAILMATPPSKRTEPPFLDRKELNDLSSAYQKLASADRVVFEDMLKLQGLDLVAEKILSDIEKEELC